MEPKNPGLDIRTLTLIAHKLRTPLSIINGYSEAILAQAGKEKFSPFTVKAMEEVYQQGGRMALLIEKLAWFNKVMSTDAKLLAKCPVVLKDLLSDCVAKTLSQSEASGLPPVQTEVAAVKRGVQVDIDCPTNVAIHGNEEMLNLCVRELLGNAIKFNNKMEKIIKVQVANHGNSISLSVRDYGVGIRPQDVVHLFEPFFQVDDDFTGQISGWGVGLSMVQRIAELHDATVSVVSDRGLGSIFTIKFPL